MRGHFQENESHVMLGLTCFVKHFVSINTVFLLHPGTSKPIFTIISVPSCVHAVHLEVKEKIIMFQGSKIVFMIFNPLSVNRKYPGLSKMLL